MIFFPYAISTAEKSDEGIETNLTCRAWFTPDERSNLYNLDVAVKSSLPKSTSR